MTETSPPSLPETVGQLLGRLGVVPAEFADGELIVRTPITGERIGAVHEASLAAAGTLIGEAQAAFLTWRNVPAPRRGALVRRIGDELRTAKADLGHLVSIETGKILSEGLGEVQEMIDICDLAVGLSRQLFGLTIATERPGHRMMETWHPLGVCGVISAFNFPVAVWSWNAVLALVCGNSVVWKPSEKTPLAALAVQALVGRATAAFDADARASGQAAAPPGLCALLIGGRALGEALVADPRVALVSATGSTAMGREVGPKLAARFARGLLELGGNNAAIVTPSADLDLTLRAVAFAALGTAGQRCTTLRRLIVHASVHEALVARLKQVYASVRIGSPLEIGTLVGPLIDEPAYNAMDRALAEAKAAGGRVTGGGRCDAERHPTAFYVHPALVEMPGQVGPVLRETFAPILYVLAYTDLAEAIALQNGVGAGLASSIFTTDMREAETFLAASGSDCGIANVNIGPSGAEIGGAFGGEKETGGGREAGADSWRAYMRRQTNTVNYSNALPLAQGVSFDAD